MLRKALDVIHSAKHSVEDLLEQFRSRWARAGYQDRAEEAQHRDAGEQILRQYFETARDPEANISSSYGTFKVPETYIIDRTGEVVQKVIGEGDWNDATVNFVKSL